MYVVNLLLFLEVGCHGAMAQNVVMLNACNCLLPVKCFLLSTSTDYLRFPFSINQIKNIKTLIIWLFKLSPQVTTCSKPQHLQTKSVTDSQSQTDSTCRKPQINRLVDI